MPRCRRRSLTAIPKTAHTHSQIRSCALVVAIAALVASLLRSWASRVAGSPTRSNRSRALVTGWAAAHAVWDAATFLPDANRRPTGQSAAAAVLTGAAMGAIAGATVACSLSSWLPGPYGCVPGGFPAGALVGALLALRALPLLEQGTRPGEPAAHRPAATTTTAARLIWLAIAFALGRWLAEGLLNPQMGLEGVAWMGILPVLLVAAAGLAMAAQGLLRRRGWARWAP
jgi:hypothetical protein